MWPSLCIVLRQAWLNTSGVIRNVNAIHVANNHEYKSSDDFVVIDLFHCVQVDIFLWVHKIVSSFTFCHFMFTLIAVSIFVMMCSFIHTFLLDFQMMESAFIWCIHLITHLCTTVVTECCGVWGLSIWYSSHAVVSNKNNTPYQFLKHHGFAAFLITTESSVSRTIIWQIKTFAYLCECSYAYNFPVLKRRVLFGST
jgi:hypothetical protein